MLTPNPPTLYPISTSSSLPAVERLHEVEVTPPKVPGKPISVWEVLGPLPVGKLEIDADPTFDGPSVTYGSPLFPDTVPAADEEEEEAQFASLPRSTDPSWDPIVHVLTMPFNATVASELLPGGEVRR